MPLGNWKGLFGRGRSESPSHAVTQSQQPIHPWDERRRLLALGDAGDWLCLGDCFTGISALGATGSGKTSTLAVLALLLMKIGCGFVWLCAKPDEVRLVRRLAKRAGRDDDVIVIGEDIDGRITPYRFNPLEYEASVPKTGTAAVVQYLSLCQEVLSHGRRRTTGGGEDGKFWQEQFERLLRYCIDTAKIAGEPLTVDLLRRIQLSAPTAQRAEQLSNAAWRASSACMRCLDAAEAREQRGEIDGYDVQRVIDFWTTDYFGLDPKPRSSIDVMFAALADSFSAEEPIRSILTRETNVRRYR